MKLKDYYVAEPLVSIIKEGESLLESLETAKNHVDRITITRLQFHGRDKFNQNKAKAIKITDLTVQKVILEAVEKATKDLVKKYRKKLDEV